MKKIILTFILLFPIRGLGGFIFAQSGTMLPDGFIVPNLATDPTCTLVEKGKLYFNTTSATLRVCNGTAWQPSSSLWSTNAAAPGTINNGTRVGIGTTTPLYDLDVNGTTRVVGTFIASNSINIGATSGNSG